MQTGKIYVKGILPFRCVPLIRGDACSCDIVSHIAYRLQPTYSQIETSGTP